MEYRKRTLETQLAEVTVAMETAREDRDANAISLIAKYKKLAEAEVREQKLLEILWELEQHGHPCECTHCEEWWNKYIETRTALAGTAP